MARKHVLTGSNKSNFSKAELQARIDKEAALNTFERLSIMPPAWLDDNSKREYERIVPLLEKLPIASLDQTLVTLYCQFYSMFLEASNDLKERGLIDVEANRANPAFNAMVKASSEIRLIASQLGMTIDSRMKIVVPEPKEVHDPFKEMMDLDF